MHLTVTRMRLTTSFYGTVYEIYMYKQEQWWIIVHWTNTYFVYPQLFTTNLTWGLLIHINPMIGREWEKVDEVNGIWKVFV